MPGQRQNPYYILGLGIALPGFMLSLFCQPLQAFPLLKNDSCSFYAGYNDFNQAGADAGGKRTEERDQNRFRHAHGISLAGDCQVAKRGPRMGGLIEWGGYHDYHYYNASEDRHDDLQYLRQAYLTLGEPTTLGISNGYMQLMTAGLRLPTDKNTTHHGYGLAIGRMDWALDFDGLIYNGKSPLITIGYAPGGNIEEISLFSLRMSVASLERQLRIRRALPESKQTPSILYTAVLKRDTGNTNLQLAYAFYRSAGRATRPDLYLSGISQERVVIPVGQTARPDLDVHYYGLHGYYKIFSFSGEGSLWHNYGRQIAVAADGTRIGSARKSIQGTLVTFKLGKNFGKERSSIHCPPVLKQQGVCPQESRTSLAHRIELETLFSTRDHDHYDTRLNGFGSIQPAPVILGGAASIFLQGAPPGRERLPFANQEPYTLASDSGILTNTEPRLLRDNSDPSLPDYANDGLRIGGLHYSYTSATYYPMQLDLRWNYADLRYGDGQEGIVSISGIFNQTTENSQKSADQHHRTPGQFIYWKLSISGASYTSHEREYNEWTGQSRRASTQYYSRYLLSVGFHF